MTVALPRRYLPAVVGHRAPTLHRLRLGADHGGRLTSLVHEVTTHTSRVKEFVEQAAVPARVMYAAPALRTVRRVAALDVPTPSWMRAPGECPGMYALESAMDELAVERGIDPVELRIRNEPASEPDGGRPFSSRRLVECLREGARRFGSVHRAPGPLARGRPCQAGRPAG
ncbi:xanthine dehydrogenase family protein molybdopterin-binding subunit [Streptomyces violaceorubidus]